MDVREERRVAGLDLMKALGLYLVVLYHLTFRQADGALSGGVRSALLYLPASFMSICVPLFFTASGALSLTRPLDLRKNTLRAIHLLGLTVFWTLASLAAVLALRRTWYGWREFFSIAWELRVGYIQHLWYLPTFVFLTLITPVLHGLRTGSARIYRYGLLLLGIFTFGNLLLNDGEYALRWMLGRLEQSGVRQFFWYVDFFSYHYWYAVIYLALGAFLLEHREALGRRRRPAAALIPLCVLALAFFGLARTHVRGTAYDPVFNNYGDPFTLLLTASVSLLLLTVQPGEFLRQAARSLADCSLGVYLIHWLLIEVLLDYFPAAVSLLWSPLTAVLVLLLSWAITWALRKLPVVRALLTASPQWIHRI